MSLQTTRALAQKIPNSGRLWTGRAIQSRGLATQVDADTSAKASEPQPKAPKPTKQELTWPQYLAIRKSRRRWETTASIPSGILGFAGGISYFGSLEMDPSKLILGMDPFFMYGAMTAACMGVGALIGPSIGGAIWRWTHRHQVQLIDEKDRIFLKHVAKNRIDASLQSATSPAPDYYGERIGSLHDYRQWLRDQNKYRRKVLLPEKEY